MEKRVDLLLAAVDVPLGEVLAGFPVDRCAGGVGGHQIAGRVELGWHDVRAVLVHAGEGGVVEVGVGQEVKYESEAQMWLLGVLHADVPQKLQGGHVLRVNHVGRVGSVVEHYLKIKQ